MKYDKVYYDEFTSGKKTYDVTRLVKKSLTARSGWLPDQPSVAVFGFGWVGYHARWAKMFATSLGYEINPTAVQRAQKA